MNKTLLNTVAINAAAIGIAVGGGKVYSKITGKPAGLPASPVHILTNDKLDKQGKLDTIKDQIVVSTKDTLKLGATVAGAGSIAALAFCKSPKAATFLTNTKNTIAEMLSNITVGNVNLKEAIKKTGLFKKINSLPTPVKVAAGVGSVILAVAAPIFGMAQCQKSGYIEGKNEAKTVERQMNANKV